MEPSWKDHLLLIIRSFMPQLVIAGLVFFAVALLAIGWVASG